MPKSHHSIDMPKTETSGELLSHSEEKSDDQEKRKRGRPKGSKNKNYYLDLGRKRNILEKSGWKTLICDLFSAPTDRDSKNSQVKQENDENDPSNVDNERVLVKTDDPDYIYGNEDIAMEDDPMDTDYNQLKRGFRKRITTKRQKALLETKRKRGRPPIKVGPIGKLRYDIQ